MVPFVLDKQADERMRWIDDVLVETICLLISYICIIRKNYVNLRNYY